MEKVKIIVLSDSHVARGGISNHLYQILSGEKPDFIVHCGDIVNKDVLVDLESIAEVLAVRGNMDFGIDLPEKRVVELGDLKIGISHGAGNPRTIEDRLKKMFANDNVDIILFGHTHRAEIYESDGILFFNPGSCALDIPYSETTIGLLVLEEGKILEKKIISI